MITFRDNENNGGKFPKVNMNSVWMTHVYSIKKLELILFLITCIFSNANRSSKFSLIK